MFLDAHQQFSNGSLTLNDYLREAKCLPLNCKLHTWNHIVMFEETHKDFNSLSNEDDIPKNYYLTYYMRNPGMSEVSSST